MKIDLQNALVETLRTEVKAWRDSERLSKESFAISFVEIHEQSGADAATDITFDFNAKDDSYTRAKKAAQKIFRWLDEGNLPANMIPTVLAVLPMDRRLHVLNAIVRPLGVEARSADAIDDADTDISGHMKAVAKEGTEAVIALHDVRPDAPESVLRSALKEVEESQEASARAARGLKSLLARGVSRLRAA